MSTDARVLCPRCGQDWLIHVRLVPLNLDAIRCPDCEALWLTAEEIGPASFVDYNTFMMQRGRVNPQGKGEIEFGPVLLRQPS